MSEIRIVALSLVIALAVTIPLMLAEHASAASIITVSVIAILVVSVIAFIAWKITR